jgi:MFS family permease
MPVHRTRALIVLAVGALDFSLEQAILAPALPAIQRHYGASPTSTTWLFTGFLLAAAIATPLAGRLGDRHGRRKLLLWSLAAFAAGSVVCAVGSSIGVLIAGRVIQGLGAGMGPLALALARDHVERSRIAFAVGLLIGAASAGSAVGLLIAGPLVEHASVSAIFWFLFAVAVLLAVAVRWTVAESPRLDRVRVDWSGGALLAGALGGVMLAISRANEWGWGSGRTLALLAACVLLLLAFAVRERTASAPLIDPGALARRAMWSANLAVFAVGFSLLIAFTLIPLICGYPTKLSGYGLGLTATQIGLVLTPSALASLAGGIFGGRLAGRTGARGQAVAGTLCATAAYLVLVMSTWSATTIALAMIPLGFGVGLALGALLDLVVLSSAPGETGATVAVNTAIRMIATVLGAQIATAVLTAAPKLPSGLPSAQGFTHAFTMSAIATLAALAAISLTPGRARDPAHAAAEVA